NLIDSRVGLARTYNHQGRTLSKEGLRDRALQIYSDARTMWETLIHDLAPGDPKSSLLSPQQGLELLRTGRPPLVARSEVRQGQGARPTRSPGAGGVRFRVSGRARSQGRPRPD